MSGALWYTFERRSEHPCKREAEIVTAQIRSHALVCNCGVKMLCDQGRNFFKAGTMAKYERMCECLSQLSIQACGSSLMLPNFVFLCEGDGQILLNSPRDVTLCMLSSASPHVSHEGWNE